MRPGFLAVFLVTLPGTYAGLLAVTWGKPVFGCFPIFDWICFFLGFLPVEFGVLSSYGFLPVFVWSLIHFWAFLLFFRHGCVKTCVIHASEMVASYEKARVITLLRECIDFDGLSAIQFCPRGLIRVTFKDAADKEDFVRVGSLMLDGQQQMIRMRSV